MNQRNKLILGLSSCLFLMTCLLFLAAGALTVFYFYSLDDQPVLDETISINQLPTPTSVPTLTLPSAAALATLPPVDNIIITSEPTPTLIPTPTMVPEATAPPSSKLAVDLPPALEQQPVPDRAFGDLDRLFQVALPEYDYYEAATSLGGFEVGPRVFQRPEFQLGDRQIFQTDEGNIEATLVAITPHVYFWVDDALPFEDDKVQGAAKRLEEEFYPRINHLFDQPWTPGIDGDDRFSILHLAGNGKEFELGYFSDQDEYPRTLFRDSNEQEIIYLNMGQLEMGSDLYFGTLIHELQHLFQWNLDKNEETWFNEGISQLAEYYAGLDTAVPDAYLEYPDTRLDRWEYDDAVIDAHYASSYLFAVYLWDQLGPAAMYELIRQPANGLASVEAILDGFQPDRSLEQFIADWSVANFVNSLTYGDRYAYETLEFGKPALQNRARQQDLPFNDSQELDQLSVHYIDLDVSGPLDISFAGDTVAKLIDSAPPSGEQMWYAPPANDTHTQLTGVFDLGEVDQATLEFDTWYDLEEGFDFAYVSVSSDLGASWRILSPHLWSSGDYGPGYTGSSADVIDKADGWIHEAISLDDFIGQEIWVRFHVLTDFESVGRGFALDNISIPETGYVDDVETAGDHWQADGFVQTGWLLPQRWSVQVINHEPNPAVIPLDLDALNQFQDSIALGENGGTLVITPLTPFVDESARYWVKVTN